MRQITRRDIDFERYQNYRKTMADDIDSMKLGMIIADKHVTGQKIDKSAKIHEFGSDEGGGVIDVHVSSEVVSRDVEGRKTMAVISSDEYEAPRVIDLGGPEGNAYVLMGIAHGYLKKCNVDPDIYLQMMKADDYGQLVRVFNELCGEFFTIVLPKGINSLDEL